MFKVLICVTDHHSLPLVLVAAVVCLLGTLASFFLYTRVPQIPAWRRWAGLGVTGLVAGSAIWTTHFVAMLAFDAGLPTGYALAPTLTSLLVAVVGTTLGFAVGSAPANRRRPPGHLALGGLILGLSITAMHYVGMSGYRTAGLLHWDLGYVAASVLIGAAISACAMMVAQPGVGLGRQAGGGGLLTLAIVGMHFTGMTAVTILPDAAVAVPKSLMSANVMAGGAVAGAVLIMLAAVAGAVFDAATRYGSLRKLREALDVMPEGIAFFDPADRLVTWNATYAEICEARGCTATVGVRFSELMRDALAAGAHPDAIGREDEWLAERVAERGKGSSVVQRTHDGRWLRVTDRRTADGGIVSTRVDITELKRAEAEMALARDEAEEAARRAEEAEAIAGLSRWRVDVRTKTLTCSNELYIMYGLDPAARPTLTDIMGMTDQEDVAAAVGRVGDLARGGEADQHSVFRIRRPDGEMRYLNSNCRVELGDDGHVASVIGTAVDVTEEKLADIALAESEARFRHLAVNAPDMIAESALDGTLKYVSPASLTVTGFQPEELVGKTFADLIEHEEDLEAVREMCRRVFESKGKIVAWPVEFRARHKAGHEVWLECKPTFAMDPTTGRFTGMTDVIRDISPRKTMEAQLRAAQAEAEAAAAVKAEFLANMSHELRTPLTSILGFTRLAAEQDDLSPLSRDYVDRVAEASRALLCTVNDILDFSKLEAGQVSIQPEPVSLSRLARGALDLFTPQAAAKDLSLTLDDGSHKELVLALDPDRIRQVLLNFVSNAVKFTASGGVTLRTRYDEAAEQLRVEVIDTGAGVPEEKLGGLFKRFSQIDGAQSRTQTGTGLGLAICKGLVEAMGGEVGVDSRLGEGSRFWFSIPAPRASLAEPAVADQPAPERTIFAGLKVLVVDDHRTNRELAKLFLAGVGAEVAEAEDGEAAVARASEEAFDIILMDLRMPKLDGMAATRRICERRGPNQHTPIIAFTADAEGMERLGPLGFVDVVAKPIEPMALISAIARACAESESPEELAKAG